MYLKVTNTLAYLSNSIYYSCKIFTTEIFYNRKMFCSRGGLVKASLMNLKVSKT